jgi:hypothetical protein
MSEEVIRLMGQSNLVPPNPHQLVTELLLPAILLQSVVAVARVFRARGGRDAAFQIVEMNFAVPILALVILSRYALPWVVGSMVAIPIYAALKAFRQKF